MEIQAIFEASVKNVIEVEQQEKSEEEEARDPPTESKIELKKLNQ